MIKDFILDIYNNETKYLYASEIVDNFNEIEFYEYLDILLSYYGGSLAIEQLLFLRKSILLRTIFVKTLRKLLNNSDHPLLHFTVFEFSFFHAGILDLSYYEKMNIRAYQLVPYEKFITENKEYIRSGLQINASMYNKYSVTYEELDELKFSLLNGLS